jgi:hypothetical protein
MATQLDYSWAKHLLTKYQEEHDLILVRNDNISSILQALMYEKDFECSEDELEDIVDMLMRNYI